MVYSLVVNILLFNLSVSIGIASEFFDSILLVAFFNDQSDARRLSRWVAAVCRTQLRSTGSRRRRRSDGMSRVSNALQLLMRAVDAFDPSPLALNHHYHHHPLHPLTPSSSNDSLGTGALPLKSRKSSAKPCPHGRQRYFRLIKRSHESFMLLPLLRVLFQCFLSFVFFCHRYTCKDCGGPG